MGVSSGRARVADLAFQVFNRAVHPDWFATRVYRRIPQERGRQTSGSLRAATQSSSAPVRFASPRCFPGPRPLCRSRDGCFTRPSGTERSASLHPGGIVEYQTCFEVERVIAKSFATSAKK